MDEAKAKFAILFVSGTAFTDYEFISECNKETVCITNKSLPLECIRWNPPFNSSIDALKHHQLRMCGEIDGVQSLVSLSLKLCVCDF